MGKPYYFQTEDEKQMAARRVNPSGRPVQMVRPMLPSNYDATEKARWGTDEFGQSKIPMERLAENYRKMRTVENVPDAAPKKQMSMKEILAKYKGTQTIQAGDNRPPGVYNEKGERVSPDRPPAAPIAATSNWQQDITKKFPDIGKEGTAANKAYVDIYKEKMSSNQPFDPMELAKDVAGKFSSDISASAPMLTVQMPTESKPTAPTLTAPTSNMPTPQWQKDVTKIYPKIGERGTPENEAYVAEYKDRMSSKQPFDTMELADDVMARFVPNTGLNTSASAPAPAPAPARMLQLRPMGMGTLSQRPTSTAPGASKRVANRRAIRMNPKSTEVARRWAKGIGGARNNDSWAP